MASITTTANNTNPAPPPIPNTLKTVLSLRFGSLLFWHKTNVAEHFVSRWLTSSRAEALILWPLAPPDTCLKHKGFCSKASVTVIHYLAMLSKLKVLESGAYPLRHYDLVFAITGLDACYVVSPVWPMWSNTGRENG